MQKSIETHSSEIRLVDIVDDLKIDTFETTLGCPVGCLQCGAFSGFKREDLIIKCLDIQKIEEFLIQIADKINRQVSSFVGPRVTTHVTSEPLYAENFCDFARLIYRISDRTSKVIAISHGVTLDNQKTYDRLDEIIELIKAKIIPHFCLTVDNTRFKGKISPEVNEQSYFETLHKLKDTPNFGRVDISLQGEKGNGPYSIQLIREMFKRIIRRLLAAGCEVDRFVISERSYTRIGRAKSQLQGTDSEDCPIIPANEGYIKYLYPQDYLYKGLMTFDRRLLVQENRVMSSYGDILDKDRPKKKVV